MKENDLIVQGGSEEFLIKDPRRYQILDEITLQNRDSIIGMKQFHRAAPQKKGE
jgi:hypothetical protein